MRLCNHITIWNAYFDIFKDIMNYSLSIFPSNLTWCPYNTQSTIVHISHTDIKLQSLAGHISCYGPINVLLEIYIKHEQIIICTTEVRYYLYISMRPINVTWNKCSYDSDHSILTLITLCECWNLNVMNSTVCT